MEGCVHVYGAAFAGLNAAAGKFVAFQTKTDGVGAAGDLHPGGRELAGGNAVDEDFRARRSRGYLGPGDVTGSGFEFEIEGGLDVVLHLDLADIGFVAFETKDQIVRARGERETDGGLPRLFITIDEDIGAGWASADVKAFCQCFEQDLLVLGISGF